MKEKKQNKKALITAVALVLLLLVTGTYAWMMLTKNSSVVNKISSGSLDIKLICEESNDCTGIHLEKTVPMSFRQGLTTQAYKFILKNESDFSGEYVIKLKDDYDGVTIPEEGKLDDSKIRYIILENDETPVASNSKLLSDGRSIKTGTINANSEVEYTIYAWIDSKAGVEVNNQVFGGRIEVTAEQEIPVYNISGILRNASNAVLPNETLAAFSKNGPIVTATTDTEGKFDLPELPRGENEVYYIPTGVNPAGMTKSQLEGTPGVAKTTITAPTDSEEAVLTNDYTINKISTKKQKKLKLGDYVKMTPVKSSFTTDPTKTGYTESQTINPKELDMWRVISINDDGTYDLVSDRVSTTRVTFNGETGYKNYVGYLNEIAKQYENSEYTIKSRHFGYAGQTEYLTGSLSKISKNSLVKTHTDGFDEYNDGYAGDGGYLVDKSLLKKAGVPVATKTANGSTGYDAQYWIPSREYYIVYKGTGTTSYHYVYSAITSSYRTYNGYNTDELINKKYFIDNYYGIGIDDKPVLKTCIEEYSSNDTCYDGENAVYGFSHISHAVRPVVTIKSGLGLKGSGTEHDPYLLELVPEEEPTPPEEDPPVEVSPYNTNIVAAYRNTYNTNTGFGCLTGQESACNSTVNECYKTFTAKSCPSGTIIKYKVNNSEEKYFYVIRDEGEKIVMQQRENTISNTAWYSNASSYASPKPDKALENLESATAGWTNVNDITYKAGTTVLYSDKYTSCDDYLNCTRNSYTLPERTAKARMITAKEAANFGCNVNRTDMGRCSIEMTNYTNYYSTLSGTVRDTSTSGYWTMTAVSGSKNAFAVNSAGYLDSNFSTATNSTLYGARAVVEINK